MIAHMCKYTNTQTNRKHKQTANMSNESIIVNDLIHASSVSKQERRLQHEKRKKMVSDEKANKMRYLTKVYFEQVNKLLLEKAKSSGWKNATIQFYVDDFKVSKELKEKGIFIGYPNEIAQRWLNQMSNPESDYLEDPARNWKGMRFTIIDRFSGVDLQNPNNAAIRLYKDQPPTEQTFRIVFSW